MGKNRNHIFELYKINTLEIKILSEF